MNFGAISGWLGTAALGWIRSGVNCPSIKVDERTVEQDMNHDGAFETYGISRYVQCEAPHELLEPILVDGHACSESTHVTDPNVAWHQYSYDRGVRVGDWVGWNDMPNDIKSILRNLNWNDRMPTDTKSGAGQIIGVRCLATEWEGDEIHSVEAQLVVRDIRTGAEIFVLPDRLPLAAMQPSPAFDAENLLACDPFVDGAITCAVLRDETPAATRAFVDDVAAFAQQEQHALDEWKDALTAWQADAPAVAEANTDWRLTMAWLTLYPRLKRLENGVADGYRGIATTFLAQQYASSEAYGAIADTLGQLRIQADPEIQLLSMVPSTFGTASHHEVDLRRQ